MSESNDGQSAINSQTSENSPYNRWIGLDALRGLAVIFVLYDYLFATAGLAYYNNIVFFQ